MRIQDGPSAAAKTTSGTNKHKKTTKKKTVSINKAAEQNLALLSKQTCRYLSCGFSVEVQGWSVDALCCWASGQNFKRNTGVLVNRISLHCICSVYVITTDTNFSTILRGGENKPKTSSLQTQLYRK